MADILSTGTPDFAAVELVRAALEAGSTDNVTCLVADVVPAETPLEEVLQPMLVGAAAELPRKPMLAGRATALFRGHRAGDTGEIEPIDAEIPEEAGFAIASDPIDPEAARYAPQARPRFVWLRRLLAALTLAGLLAIGIGAGQWWLHQQYYVGEQDGVVTIFRGVAGDLLGYQLSEPYESTNLTVSQLSAVDARAVTEGLDAEDLDAARAAVERLYAEQVSPGASEAG